MAYAAVLSLNQTLEEHVLPFLFLIIEIKKTQVRALHKKAYEAVRLLEKTPVLPESRLDQLEKEIDPLATKDIQDFMEAVGSDKLQPVILKFMLRIFDTFPGTLRKSPIEQDEYVIDYQLKNEIDSIREHLDDFLKHTIFFYIWEDISTTSARRRSKKLVNQLHSANEELKKAIDFFDNVVSKTISIRGKVCTLLKSLKDNNHHEVVNRIKDVVDEAGESIENCLIANPVVLDMTHFMESSRREVHLDTVVNNIFSEVQFIHGCLGQTIGVSYRDAHLGSTSRPKHYWESSLGQEDDLSPKSIGNRELYSIHGDNNEDEDIIAYRNFQLRIDSNLKCSWESPLRPEDVVVGLDADINKIIDELTRPPFGLQIQRIVGMGGIGKTTLARKVFHDPNVVKHFHCVRWVDRVSKVDPVREVLSNLVYSFVPFTDEIQGKSIEDVGQDLRRRLKGKRYLIVIDDLWNVEAWDAVQMYFPDDNNGSRLLITSRFKEIHNHVNHKDHPHNMRLLNKKQSWELMEKLVYGEKGCPAELVGFGKKIAEKCGGLPLAIVVISGTISRIQSTPNCWSDVADRVHSIVCTDPQQCLDILAVSYNLLPHHLKACFLYMSAFPAYSEIQVWKLISLWMAEGFLDSKSSNNLEEMAEGYLEDLIARSLLLVTKRGFGGKIKACRIQDLLRELCLREAQKVNFMRVLETDAQDFPARIDKQRRLIFNLDNCADLQLLPSTPLLRSFIWLTLGSDFIPGIIALQLSGFKLLRVLDMYFLRFDAFPVLLLNLVNLRYLALNVTYELDASMSELWKLQSLIIYGPWINNEESPTLSLEYWSMPWLRHLHVTVPSSLRNPSIFKEVLPHSLAPRYLQTLSTITFSSCTKEVFSIMFHLKKLGISETKEDYNRDPSSECLKSLACLRELEMLKCSFYRGNREARRLCSSALPSSLKKLTLSGSYLSWENMTFIASLPKLEMLKLKHYAFQGPKWELTTEVFCCLKQILIDNTDLVNWEATSTDHFPCLEHLVLRSCKSLEEIPYNVLSCILKQIELHYCSESAKKSAREFQEQYGSMEVVNLSDWMSCSP